MSDLKRSILTTTLTLACAAAFSMPPRSGRLAIPQPDGSAIEAEIYGDGTWCMYVTPDGRILRADESGMLVPSGRTLGSEADRSSAVRSMSSRFGKPLKAASTTGSYPTKGKIKTLIILAEFADMKFMSENPADLIGRMISEKGFSHGGATGSVCDYFADNSFGQFELDPMVIGPVTLPGKMAYYGAPDSEGRADARPAEMIRDACNLVDAQVDFSEFDLDNDGYIDNVYVFYPGYSQADGASVNTIWPHSGFAWSAMQTSFDGVRLDKYACSNEIDMSTNKLVGIGTFCHEFSHVLGLPDLYATDYSNEEHPGIWSIMASGGRNNSGHTPPAFSAYERYFLGWVNPEELKASDSEYTLPADGSAFMISTDSDKEYYIVENRQRSGWDTYLPGHGMLVWHIDYDETAWKRNNVNNDASHQRIDLIEADGSASESTRGGDAFPGNGDIREWTSIKPWTGTAINAGLFNIRENSDGTVSFNMASTGNKLATPAAQEASEISPGSFRINWDAVPQATSYVLEVYSKKRQGSVVSKVYVEGFRLYMAGDSRSAEVTGLKPSTEYFYTIRAFGDGSVSDTSEEYAVTTLEPDFRSAMVKATEATEIASDGFTANWAALDNAESYRITVKEITSAAAATHTNDFADNVMAPSGWLATPGCTTSSFTGYYGKSAPGISMSSGGSYVQSPVETDIVESVSFWCRGVKTEDRHQVRVFGFDGTQWQQITAVSPLVTDRAGTNVTLRSEFDNIPCYSVYLEFYKPTSKGTLVLDDIVVSHRSISGQILENYDGLDVGGALSVRIDGLKPATLYSYTVTASDGRLVSSASLPRMARTLNSSGIGSIESDGSDAVEVTAAGGAIRLANRGDRPVDTAVYSIAGICLYHGSLNASAEVSVELAGGIYIVKAGTAVKKVAL